MGEEQKVMPDEQTMTISTPGPWVAAAHFAQRNGGRSYIPIIRCGNDPVPLAVVHRDVDGYGKAEGEANARLIAAAPDLLAALMEVMSFAGAAIRDRTPRGWGAARAAITKANGPDND